MDLISLLIDARHQEAGDLCPHIAQLLCAGTPAQYGFNKVLIAIDKRYPTRWPAAPWLEIVECEDDDDDQFTRLVESHIDQPLVTLNTAIPSHNNNHVVLSDRFVSKNLFTPDHDSLFNRLRQRVVTSAAHSNLENAKSLFGFSCYATAHIAKIGKPCYTLPMGIPPQFFIPKYDHPVVNKLSRNSPFIWLTSLVENDDGPIMNCIEATKVLHDFGTYIELRILMPESYSQTTLTSDAEKKIVEACKGKSYLQIVNAPDTDELLEHFMSVNGYIWNYRTDKYHRDVLLAMACSLPLLASHSQMIKKHVGNRTRFFEFGNSDDLANKLEQAIADIHFRILSSSRNHRAAMAYTWEKSAGCFFGLLRSQYQSDQPPGASAP